MPPKSDVTPISQGKVGHSHRWYPMQIKNIFEPENNTVGPPVYTMVEYAYLSCICGAVIKSRVKENPNAG